MKAHIVVDGQASPSEREPVQIEYRDGEPVVLEAPPFFAAVLRNITADPAWGEDAKLLIRALCDGTVLRKATTP